MANKSKVASATPKARTRKSKEVSKPQPIIYPLSQYEIEHRSRNRAFKELSEYILSLTEAEKLVVADVCPFGNPIAGMNEMKRLLGESIAKCKVIPFPVGGKRGPQISKGA
ncbi:hypothetical protein C8R27_11289 [Nitrosomonas ureae]|uniref:hypothetical protein n=1 Tax=Nitrosomonas ureae TaxID=44577 RepID=UPI000D75813F|nr:hypothetical protein [Nitrosomonas ureae]PXX15097.1 hypothetical protein C8R27_11289 [Nitrosomonas ureae]